ncbi:MAG: hypothetical protein ACE5K3_07160 [bacterium]
MIEKAILRFSKTPELQRPSLIVGWSRDAGKLGIKVINFLNEELGSEEFCQIRPTVFFPLRGVEVENDVVRFPESKFYFCGRLEEISQEIKTQNEEIYKLRRRRPVVDKYLSQLEGGFMLNEKEQEKLVKEVYQSLKEYE